MEKVETRYVLGSFDKKNVEGDGKGLLGGPRDATVAQAHHLQRQRFETTRPRGSRLQLVAQVPGPSAGL